MKKRRISVCVSGYDKDEKMDKENVYLNLKLYLKTFLEEHGLEQDPVIVTALSLIHI